MTDRQGPASEADSTALIADDDFSMRLLIRQSLEDHGFRVVEAENGIEAIEVFNHQKPDLVLLDVQMPHLDGYSVCRKIRQLKAGLSVPIVMVTGKDDVDSVNQAYEAGATDFISKPINWTVLGYRMRYVLRSSNAFRYLQAVETKNKTLIQAFPDRLFRLEGNKTFKELQTAKKSGSGERHYDGLDDRYIDADLVAQQAEKYVKRVRETGVEQCFEFASKQGPGTRYYEQRIILISDDEGDGDGEVLAIVRDISERRSHEQEVHKLAYYDCLTGLPNRQLFYDQLQQEIRKCHRNQEAMAVLFIDLDRFKVINDTLGHSFGDGLLARVAELIEGCVRQSDVVARATLEDATVSVARIGGDEFTVLIGPIEKAQSASVVARRIIETLTSPIVLEGHRIDITASIGIAAYPYDGLDAEILLKHADAAMYQAKDRGRNNFQFYSSAVNEQVLLRLRLETNLRFALEQNALQLSYQPQVDIHTGQLIGFEALARWNDPEHGSVSPTEFIPIAEEAGLINDIGEWVLKEACKRLKAWHDAGFQQLRMSVNVSSRQLYRGEFEHVVDRIIKEAGLKASSLEIELTESSIMEDPERSITSLRHLHEKGVTIAIDDFGTGYSSLSYLTKLPLSVLKIDQSFVRDITLDPDDAALTTAIITMAKSLKLGTVAEGVETREQLEYLRDNGCDVVQGFLFSQPMTVSECRDLLDVNGLCLVDIIEARDDQQTGT